MQGSFVFMHLPAFSPEKDNLKVYVERFEEFASVNKVDNDTKQQVFLTLIGDAAYITLRSFLFSKTPAEHRYDDVVKILLKHFAPKRSVLAARCDFGTILEEALRSCFIVGFKNDMARTSASTGPTPQPWEWKLVKDIARNCGAQMKRQPGPMSRKSSTGSESPHRGKVK
ncbi:hypothetical protein HPB47_014353 [Ixodes persulcatus]|uniref:Uncharacterized protein n=1 Tax=Ixodes persulcatus TaxID=34615 RepID=A0AC60QW95_IXOPE|nr:hypothetical protein HPB47_014353 [Ixodes persulcatus]